MPSISIASNSVASRPAQVLIAEDDRVTRNAADLKLSVRTALQEAPSHLEEILMRPAADLTPS